MSRERSLSGPKASTKAEDSLRLQEEVTEAIERFRSGTEREESFRFLYRRFFPVVERFFARKGFLPQDCSDLAQETFLEIYTGLPAYRGEGRFEAWLFTIATSTYRKRLRAAIAEKRSGPEISQDEAEANGPLPGTPARQLDGLLQDERRAAMRAAVERLPEQMRKCLTLRLYQQLSYREIAVVLKIKIDTVKVHLFRGREKLREELQAYSLGTLER